MACEHCGIAVWKYIIIWTHDRQQMYYECMQFWSIQSLIQAT